MKKITLLFLSVLALSFSAIAQPDPPVTVNLDPDATWLGFANVFETPANGGGFVFASGWGVPDLKSVITPGTSVTVQPNFNTWNPGDPFWVVGGMANKYFEANTFVEFNNDPAYLNREVTFIGNIQSYTLTDANYNKIAFIKVFPGDFSSVKQYDSVISATGDFTITFPEADIDPLDAVIQVGFQVFGPIADPATEGALGSIVAVPQVLSTDEFEISKLKAYPNPTLNTWTIESRSDITDIRLYDVLGKEVLNMQPNSLEATVDGQNLSNGLYFAKVTAVSGSQTIRLVKE